MALETNSLKESLSSDEEESSSEEQSDGLFDDENSESDDSDEARLAERQVEDTERHLSRTVDDSIWEGRGPSRIKTWTTSAAFFSQPLLINQIHLTPLVNKWYKDVIVIPHNAIKMELIDLYKIIRSFEAFRNKVGSQDVARFFTWFDLAQKFILGFLDCDEELIMKPVDSVTNLPAILSAACRHEEKQAIHDSFTIVNTFRVKAEVLKQEDNTFTSFIQSCRILASRLTNYLSMKERHVPIQIQKYSNEGEVNEMQDAMIMRLRASKKDGEKLYLLYMRDLDVRTVRDWNKKYLRWMQRNLHFRKWKRQLKAQHYNLIDQIWHDVGDPGNTYLPGAWGKSSHDGSTMLSLRV
mmetsp:Transcript_27/g.76  ORF Transcript_27/g.76 Transcript_27/m.76 type:complete len:353 (-) Transcript_27:880-1938(-)